MHSKTIDINESTIKKYVESLRPEDPKTREQLDFGYTYDGKVVILYEIRHVWGTLDQKQISDLLK